MIDGYFRKVQRSNTISQTVNIPKEISIYLKLEVGDVVLYRIENNKVELLKAII